jgi:hypothetical protein
MPRRTQVFPKVFWNTTLLATLFLVGISCSQSVVSPENASPNPHKLIGINETPDWIWSYYTIAVTEDLTNAELIPVRSPALHLNVNKFVEGPPCPDCLKIGKPILQPDGTIKLKVWLSHPFPGQPEYTGFDVRGITIFKATDHYYFKYFEVKYHDQTTLMEKTLLYYSDPEKGGGALLNPDGYTFYLNPLLEIPEPPEIYNYYPGKYAQGEPDCTVNPYILFSDGSHRRMFKTWDFITRTYHIKLPDNPGPFEFGYVVSACWAPPVKAPVTDPENDFPVTANCEDPWKITIEQLQPISYDVTNEPLFKVTLKHRPGAWPGAVRILTPTLSTSESYEPYSAHITWQGPYVEPDFVNFIDDETTEVILRIIPAHMESIGKGLVPGWHLGILRSGAAGVNHGQPPSQLRHPLGVHPIMVYVEE